MRNRGNREGSRRGGFGRGGFGRGGFRGGSRGRGSDGNRGGNRVSSNYWTPQPKKESPGKRLSEEQIAVTQYMSDQEGFNGIIKSRYSDFQVSEINEQGEVAKLTNLTPPEPPAEEQVEEDEELILSKYNVEILPMETWDQINKVAEGTVAEAFEIDVSKSSKEERTKIHDAVKKAFGHSIVGSTINTEDKKLMRFMKYKKGVRIDARVKWPWPADHVYFVLHKENCDTMDAAVRVAERLGPHIKPSMLGYAGTKDRRAKTTQWFSVRRVDPRRVAAACAGLRGLALGDYSFHRDQLRLGMLKGNRFRIAVRNVTADAAAVAEACAQFAARGFINYYGLQRFGSHADVPSYTIGHKLLLGQFQEAIDSILSPREGPMERALELYKSEGAGAALAALPRHCQAHSEARLLHALADKPRDLLTALHKIPRNTRLLYMHSYQSLVWNRCASERIERRGLAPAAGDLVPAAPLPAREEIKEESDSEETEDGSDKQIVDDETKAKPAEQTSDKREEKYRIPVKVLTQEDVDSGAYTIFDVILPLPGYLIEYPPNLRDYYEALLMNDGLTMELRHKHKSYSMSGAYRALCVRAEDVSWRCVRYGDPRQDLLLSDLDQLRGVELSGTDEGAYTALLLTLSLPSSCYATMALRELLKMDMAADQHAAQDACLKRKHSEEGRAEGEKKTKENDQ